MEPGRHSDNPYISEAIESRPRRLSFVWLLPIIAMIIGGWLIYNNFIEKDVIISLHMESGAGLIAGKTQVKHKGVIIGVIKKFRLDDDLKSVVAKVSISRNAVSALRDGTLFWLVEPRISIEGVTGLETLVSGTYIEIRPGHGKPKFEFQVLSNPPPLPESEPGLHLVLKTSDLGSIRPGSPVLYRKVVVGSIQSYDFNKDNTGVDVKIHIKSQYASLVTPCSRFWNSSGISLTGDLGGLTLHAESLVSIIAGGISFYTPSQEDIKSTGQCKNGDTFILYEDYQSANAGIPVNIAFDSANGLTPNKTKVFYKGVEVGILKKIDINKNLDGVVGEFLFVPHSLAALNETTRFWTVKPRLSFTEISGLDTLLSGIYLEMDFELNGNGKRDFKILKEPPLLSGKDTGMIITLKSDALNSINRGTPIFYRKLKVGSVLSFRLSKDSKTIMIDAIIENQYTHLVRSNSRFWNSSGLSIKGGISGIAIHAESLETMLSGGISFETPDKGGVPVKNGHGFALFANYEIAIENGIPISIRFDRGLGLKEGSPIRFKDVDVGFIKRIRPDKNLASVEVDALLNRDSGNLARQDSRFWIVRPKLGIMETKHLETLVSGNYIALLPGTGDPAFEFIGSDQPPVAEDRPDGLGIVLWAPRLGSLKKGVPIYYKDVPVGEIVDFSLSDTANKVMIHGIIASPYAPLVRTNSKFWNISGMNFDFGLFRGANFEMDSLESLIEGGIAFATPNPPDTGAEATENQTFELHDKMDKSWLDWAPSISIDTIQPNR
ncbi:MAG: MCE family protein [Proteobacteria bacterium]|nr:MCE family protein [Pseudomonadota bacterium]